MKKSFLAIMLVLAAFLVTLVAGCSSSDGGSPVAPVITGETGSIDINIAWPADGRVIPAGTQSIKVVVTRIGGGYGPTTTIMNRSTAGTTSTVVVPVGNYKISGSAWDAAGGLGNVLGSSTIALFPVNIGPNHANLVLTDQIYKIIIQGDGEVVVNDPNWNRTGLFVRFGVVGNIDTEQYPFDGNRVTWSLSNVGSSASINPVTGEVTVGPDPGLAVLKATSKAQPLRNGTFNLGIVDAF